MHDALVAAGYDRSFEQIEADGPERPTGAACGGAVEIEGGTIRLGPGVRLDLGGIAKGYAVDRACDVLAAAGPASSTPAATSLSAAARGPSGWTRRADARAARARSRPPAATAAAGGAAARSATT